MHLVVAHWFPFRASHGHRYEELRLPARVVGWEARI